MAIYAIADLHLSFGVNKSMSIFPGWENYMEKLSDSLQNTLLEEDTLIIPGDISWGMTLEESLPDFLFLERLPGRKILLKGNHDYYWTTRSKMEDFFERNDIHTLEILHNDAKSVGEYAVCGTRGWVNDGSEEASQKLILREAGRLKRSIQEAKKIGGKILCFLHYPPVFAHKKCEEIWEVLVSEKIETCYYGHIHGKGMRFAHQGNYEGITLKLISADFLHFKPYQII